MGPAGGTKGPLRSGPPSTALAQQHPWAWLDRRVLWLHPRAMGSDRLGAGPGQLAQQTLRVVRVLAQV